MKIRTRWKGMRSSQALLAHARRRLGFALGRFTGKLRGVQLSFEDTNGPRGGLDKRCVILLEGDFGRRHVQALDTDFYVAVDRAVDIAARVVGRAASRARRLTGRHPLVPFGPWSRRSARGR